MSKTKEEAAKYIAAQYSNPDVSYIEKDETGSYTISCVKCGDKFACYIDKYDLLFGGSNEDNIRKKARAMVKMHAEFKKENPHLF